ncbi:Mannan endo-1,4-beta-mannosidase 4 [Ancistrocladus abbreviatus]
MSCCLKYKHEMNGHPFYINGFTAYWLMLMASNPSTRYLVTNAYQQAAANGLTVARTVAYSDGGSHPLQYAPGQYNKQMFQGLDFVISEAGKYAIKLILTLSNHWDDYGGKKAVCGMGTESRPANFL